MPWSLEEEEGRVGREPEHIWSPPVAGLCASFQLVLTVTSLETLSHSIAGETMAHRDKVTCFFRLLMVPVGTGIWVLFTTVLRGQKPTAHLSSKPTRLKSLPSPTGVSSDWQFPHSKMALMLHPQGCSEYYKWSQCELEGPSQRWTRLVPLLNFPLRVPTEVGRQLCWK